MATPDSGLLEPGNKLPQIIQTTQLKSVIFVNLFILNVTNDKEL